MSTTTTCTDRVIVDRSCKPWDVTQQFRTNNYADMVNSESVTIAGAQINVYKLLGVYEQSQLINATQNGTAISGGDIPGFPAANAVSAYVNEWRSIQAGTQVLASAFIGYDFGVVALPNGRARYAVTANERKLIGTFSLKQSANQVNRVTKIRVERSDDGTTWYGVAVVNLADNDLLNTYNIRQSVASRYWRFRPLTFNGSSCDYWGVQAFQLMDYITTDITNIQDPVLLESRDRNFSTQPITIKGFYQQVTNTMELSMFGRILPQTTYSIKVNFNDCVAAVGRPIIVGDIIELPSEIQYTPQLQGIKRYIEVSDVTWDPGSYTPGWMPLMLLITAAPAFASQETQDIFGDLTVSTDNSGLFQQADQPSSQIQDSLSLSQMVDAAADSAVPELGSEGSNTVRQFSDQELAAADALNIDLRPLQLNPYGLYVEDAIPQNGASYTEGPEFPTSPADGDYHRLTYVGLAQDVPARLYRYSVSKGQWIYLETDKRGLYNAYKKTLQEFTSSPNSTFAEEIK